MSVSFLKISAWPYAAGKMPSKQIGVLALQGDFHQHIQFLKSLKQKTREVRQLKDLKGLDALVIPGGESTAIMRLLPILQLDQGIREFAASGKAIMGTCAGAILLAKEISNSPQGKLGLLDINVQRNAYGRQINSFEADISLNTDYFPDQQKPFPAIFIRAPKILSCGGNVEVLASYDKTPVLVRQKNILAMTFHPELTGDNRIHQYFLKIL